MTTLQNCYLVAVLLAGCFTEPQNPALKCDDANPCPDSRTCVAGMCSQPADASVSGGDLADMPDGAVNPAPACRANNGVVVGTNAEACAGLCAMGTCDQLCGDGYHVCTDGAQLNLTLLKSLDGFFLANQPGNYVSPLRSQPSCGAAVSPKIPIIFGAGKNQPYVSEIPGKPCAGFTQSSDCGATPSVITCVSPFDFAHVGNTDAKNGVICCKN